MHGGRGQPQRPARRHRRRAADADHDQHLHRGRGFHRRGEGRPRARRRAQCQCHARRPGRAGRRDGGLRERIPMTEISQGTIEQAIQATCKTVLRNEYYFSDLDGLAGDGDFGTSLATGFRVIENEWGEIDKSDIGAMLLKIAMLVSKHVGGSSGPIWGTGFMRAAMLTRGKEAITLQDLADMLGSAIEGIQARGGAKLGDKTLLDALIPVHETLKTHAASAGFDLGATLKEAADEAENAI